MCDNDETAVKPNTIYLVDIMYILQISMFTRAKLQLILPISNSGGNVEHGNLYTYSIMQKFGHT